MSRTVQTRARARTVQNIIAPPTDSARDDTLSSLMSTRRGAPVVDQFRSFSSRRTDRNSASHVRFPPHTPSTPTPSARQPRHGGDDATQVRGYGEGALQHHFYNGLPDRIKDEVSRIGKPRTLGELRTLSQTIDGRYWERKSEVARQTKTSGTQPSTSKSNSNTSSSKPAQSSANPTTPNASSSSSKGKPFTPNPKPQSDLSSKLGKDGRLTAEERKHRFDLKLCMFCGNAGHMAKDCRKSSSSASKARAAKTATPETQPEASTTEAKK
ncbi:hypothetical protein PAXINDRAFT_18920 [Paxillus involutus ATCC 200175]|uniref:Unplaced genomic scaffold PAXINscaffold_429, whole genome shotgun sequence n=1 Tax=Paxillus involutus ATCC 200175 TaxID=664439 RepID=A0A0C9T9Y7_PAXIN|nr:hypothetical protein PAXINDRAFT_18920 [Paxillus involutus ATCC 200175]